MSKIDLKEPTKKLIELYSYNSISFLNKDNGNSKECYFKIKENNIYLLIFSDIDNEESDLKYGIKALSLKGIDISRIEIYMVLVNEEDEFNNSKYGGRYIISHGDYTEYFILFEESKMKITTHGGEKAKIVAEEIKNSFNAYFNEHKQKEKQPILTLNNLVITINILVFLFSVYVSKNIMNIDSETLVNMGAEYPPFIAQGEYYRLFTAMFLHGGLMHIAFNMYALFIIGRMVENIYGKFKYIIIYLVGGICAGLSSYFINPSNTVSVGASGAIFGLLGSILIFAFFRRRILGKKFYYQIVQVIAINLVIGFVIPNIDNYGHIGGLLGGVVISTFLYDRYKDG